MAKAATTANPGVKSGVRIVVAGDRGTGKSSLIVTAISETFPSSVPPVLPPTRMPDDFYPDRVPITIIDTSSKVEDAGKVAEELKRADAVVLTYACDRPETLDRLSTFWLPELRQLEVKVPVIVVGCKLDLRDENQQVSLEQVMSPIMQQFREIETCIECSAFKHIQIPEVFYYAQKAVLHPTGPLFDQESQTLKPRCVRALKRIFILCDLDRDGALSDAELNEFQVKCFNAPLQPSEIIGVKRVVEEKLPGGGVSGMGVNDCGLTLTGFLFLHALFIEKGRLETTWTVLRKFGYNNDINRGGQAVVPLPLPPSQFSRIEGNVKGLIVDENGLDVLYWRKLEEEDKKNSFLREERRRNSKSEPIQEIPLLRGKSSTSEKKVVPETTIPTVSHGFVKAIEKQNLTSQPSNSNLPLTLSPAPPPPPLQSSMAIPNKQVPAPPPLQSSMAIPNKQVPPPPPPPTIPAKKNQPPPPPPPKAASSNLPPLQKGNPSKGESGESSTGQGSTTAAAGNGQVKLKPLHWDKVNTNAGQSMVWDKIDGGSFRVDDNLMEALFGFVATNRKSPKSDSNSSNSNNLISSSSSQIVILDARKSQNMAIVLKSLAISRSELLDALTNGQGLSVDTLEKLMRIAPTKEEESQILEFGGDTTRLADAESFLYHLLKAIPTAFSRINAMLFRSNYDAEILHFKESLQILESGCKELRNRGLFIKLLEAILKAGNRMNAGTSRGNAQAFKLTSLGKLSDVKSMDGKTTLLHFVVEEVVRTEGKRCVLNRNRSLSRNSSQRSNSSVISEDSASKGEREKEYMMLGLPAVGGLSIEFSNVKKAAQIDYDTFAATCSALATGAREVRAFMSQCAAANGEGGFVREMKGFLEAAEEELKGLTKEQTRVMDLVKKTTEYYHAGASKDQEAHALQLFSIIKDFLCMVDQVCIEITRNLQRRKTSSRSVESSPKSPSSRMPVRFPNLPPHFMKEKSMNYSSESDSDF